MPVDLTCVPARVENHQSPSVRRWLVFLLVLVAGNGLITAGLWPEGVSTRIPLFWICFPGGALLVWLLCVIVRSVFFLTPAFGNSGWNDERDADLAQEIQRGQRCLSLLNQVVQLPHAVGAGSLSSQLLLAEGIVLPASVDPSTQHIIHQARFDDISQPYTNRLIARLQVLLSDSQMQPALQGLPQQSLLTIALQISSESTMTQASIHLLEQVIRETIGASFRFSFIEGAGPDILDRWLDEPEWVQSLLVLAVNLSEKDTDGTGEAAVALLLQRTDSPARSGISVHRPEPTHSEKGIAYALQQALRWGMSTPDGIRQIWLAGTGTENKAEGLFSGAGIRFSEAGQPCDIDLRTGQTGCASFWLAIAVAADNVTNTFLPQLIMSAGEENDSPWFMVIRSQTESV